MILTIIFHIFFLSKFSKKNHFNITIVNAVILTIVFGAHLFYINMDKNFIFNSAVAASVVYITFLYFLIQGKHKLPLLLNERHILGMTFLINPFASLKMLMGMVFLNYNKKIMYRMLSASILGGFMFLGSYEQFHEYSVLFFVFIVLQLLIILVSKNTSDQVGMVLVSFALFEKNYIGLPELLIIVLILLLIQVQKHLKFIKVKSLWFDKVRFKTENYFGF